MSPLAPPRLALALGLLVLAAPVSAQNYPRLGLYGRVLGSGYPYTSGGVIQGPFDTAALDAAARYDQLILTVTPISEYRPQLLSELRLRNPKISLLAYVVGTYAWDGPDGADSTIHYPTRYRHLLRDLNGYLYNRAGGRYSHANVNLAKRSVLGQYVVAEAIAALWNDVAIQPGIWDGLFVDSFCDGILWTQTPAESIDFRRAGYPSPQSFDAAWRAGTEVLANRLRALGGPDLVLVGNCAQGTKYVAFNGWMRENFPFQNGGSWQSNMFRAPGGYFTDDERFRKPPNNYVFAAADLPIQPYSPASMREVRFVLGTAALGSGYGVFGPGDLDIASYPYHLWWYDEYGVDLATGRSSTSLAHTGWLGEAIGPRRQMCWIGASPDASTNPEFDTTVSVGWVLDAVIPATITRDATAPASGLASARLDLPARGGHEQDVQFATAGRIPVTAGQPYSATFWAKASEPCTISVAAGAPRASSGDASMAIGTTWQRHQVVINPSASGSMGAVFFLGRAPRQLWLDDVHFQAGITHVYRRDFRNGMVLVNPWSTPMDVALGRSYRRIQGVADPTRNDGAVVTAVTVPPSDALFLIGDGMPPNGVVDLRPTTP